MYVDKNNRLIQYLVLSTVDKISEVFPGEINLLYPSSTVQYLWLMATADTADLIISRLAFRPSDNWTCTFQSVKTELQKRLVRISFANLKHFVHELIFHPYILSGQNVTVTFGQPSFSLDCNIYSMNL
jgi:hypothetical protein